MQITEQELKEMQTCILDMLKAIHKVCEEHNLTYYMIAGTQLGAVRHHGFVPWDDDADLALPRKDYDTLIAHANEWLPEHYRLVDATKDAMYPYDFARVHDIRTTYLLYRRFNYYTGVPVDIFPLDGMIEDGLKRWWHYYRYRWAIRMRYYATVDPHKHAGVRGWLVQQLQKRLNAAKWHARANAIQSEYDYDTCQFVADHDNAPSRGILPKHVYGQPQAMPFEDCNLNGVQDPHHYLSYCYGDYMTPVPLQHPNFRELDLHKSYLDR